MQYVQGRAVKLLELMKKSLMQGGWLVSVCELAKGPVGRHLSC